MACQTKMNPKGVPLPNYMYYNAPINVLAKGGDLIIKICPGSEGFDQ